MKEEHAGRRFKCPGCGSAVQAPVAKQKPDVPALPPETQNSVEDWFAEELSRPATPPAAAAGDRDLSARSPSRTAAEELHSRERMRPRAKRKTSAGNWASSVGRFLLIVLAIVTMRPALLGYMMARESQEHLGDSEGGSFLRSLLKVILIVVLIIVLVPVAIVFFVAFLFWLR